MPQRRLPVRPDLDQLRRQAKELLRAAHAGDRETLDEFARFHPRGVDPAQARLGDAQLVLARAYQASSWPRLVMACRLAEAIWRDDAGTARDVVRRYPQLLRENVLVRESNWGPPLSYAANLGRDKLVGAFLDAGATDLAQAMNRAVLQGHIETARILQLAAGSPAPPPDALRDPAYTLNVRGTAFVFESGGRVRDADGTRLAPVEVVLGSDSRRPEAKHAILEMYVRQGFDLPDTPTMALHRGRFDLLDKHLTRDPGLLNRQFAFAEIYPPELGCSQKQSLELDGAPANGEVLMTYGAPLNGATLLHMCAD